ncbi:DUF6737 family protein [Synechococcus sp. MIT S9451]|uniref:DUF6737 family protein n=1 Tax=Synechococcus sp. MIT S9451 TaxID=3082543 RepID=UPI0039B55EC0
MTDPPSSQASSDQTADLWALKPWWCQPWSILLTGLCISLASWWFFHFLWLTIAVSLAVLLWWLLFLVLAPSAYRLAAEQDQLDRNIP